MQADFCEIERVNSYNLIHDTSVLQYKGYKISLNLIAKKCIHGPMNMEPTIDPFTGITIPPLANFEIRYEEYDPYD